MMGGIVPYDGHVKDCYGSTLPVPVYNSVKTNYFCPTVCSSNKWCITLQHQSYAAVTVSRSDVYIQEHTCLHRPLLLADGQQQF